VDLVLLGETGGRQESHRAHDGVDLGSEQLYRLHGGRNFVVTNPFRARYSKLSEVVASPTSQDPGAEQSTGVLVACDHASGSTINLDIACKRGDLVVTNVDCVAVAELPGVCVPPAANPPVPVTAQVWVWLALTSPAPPTPPTKTVPTAVGDSLSPMYRSLPG
jgi:hypothetical protein